jgi:hypothetical protein
VPAILLLAATTNKCGSYTRLNGFRDRPAPARIRMYLFFANSPPRASERYQDQLSIYPLPNSCSLRGRGAHGGMTSTSTAATTWNARIAKFHQPCLGQLACSPARNQRSRPGVCACLYARSCLVVPKPTLQCQSFLLVSRRSCLPPGSSLVL